MSGVQQQIISLAVVFGVMQVATKLNLDTPENANYIRAAYATMQVVQAALLYYIYIVINKKNDDTELKYTEVKNAMDSSEAEIVETTVRDYDIAQLRQAVVAQLVGMMAVVGIHTYWGYLRPMTLQIVLGLKTIYDNPMAKIHLFNQHATGDLQRPIKPKGMFAPKPAPSVKEIKAKQKKDDKKKVVNKIQ
ncbi:hypothetical protein SeMB42_g05843 [Synchytrium endobioticum]|uniref:Inorganic phosphate transporter n=1 Tax=Synchytrium endobioticum TaxID=286115 RepID=A0A507CP24_9FUNG|nr:hypothetical protein SeMB42_g05843 [Synchytrium endobioticum]TPX48916.1 hypothetical protein SeLEV6574_g01768 [Synchytrium endobioticum]